MKELRVIAIPDEYTIYINSGSKEDIIKKGHILSVVESGKELFDIDGNSLGNALRVKDTIEVIHIFPNFSICKKRKAVSDFVNTLFLGNEDNSPYISLNVKKSSITPLFNGDITPIEIGDLAIIK